MTSPDHADPSPRAPAPDRARERIRDGLGEEVVVDVLFALVAEEGDDVFDVVVLLLEGPGGDQVCPGAGADEQADCGSAHSPRSSRNPDVGRSGADVHLRKVDVAREQVVEDTRWWGPPRKDFSPSGSSARRGAHAERHNP